MATAECKNEGEVLCGDQCVSESRCCRAEVGWFCGEGGACYTVEGVIDCYDTTLALPTATRQSYTNLLTGECMNYDLNGYCVEPTLFMSATPYTQHPSITVSELSVLLPTGPSVPAPTESFVPTIVQSPPSALSRSFVPPQTEYLVPTRSGITPIPVLTYIISAASGSSPGTLPGSSLPTPLNPSPTVTGTTVPTGPGSLLSASFGVSFSQSTFATQPRPEPTQSGKSPTTSFEPSPSNMVAMPGSVSSGSFISVLLNSLTLSQSKPSPTTSIQSLTPVSSTLSQSKSSLGTTSSVGATSSLETTSSIATTSSLETTSSLTATPLRTTSSSLETKSSLQTTSSLTTSSLTTSSLTTSSLTTSSRTTSSPTTSLQSSTLSTSFTSSIVIPGTPGIPKPSSTTPTTPVPPPNNHHHLSGGAIAGIVLGVVFAIAVLGVLALILWRGRHKPPGQMIAVPFEATQYQPAPIFSYVPIQAEYQPQAYYSQAQPEYQPFIHHELGPPPVSYPDQLYS